MDCVLRFLGVNLVLHWLGCDFAALEWVYLRCLFFFFLKRNEMYFNVVFPVIYGLMLFLEEIHFYLCF